MKPILTLTELAERWGVPPGDLRRRMRSLGLPAVNVGSARAPDYRFRLAAIEEWEARNEQHLARPDASEEVAPVPAGRPPWLEGYDPFRDTRRKRHPRG